MHNQKQGIEQYQLMKLDDYRVSSAIIDANAIQLLIARSGFYGEFAVANKSTATVIFKNKDGETVFAYTSTVQDVSSKELNSPQWMLQPAEMLAVKAYLNAVELYFPKEMQWLKNTLYAVANDLN